MEILALDNVTVRFGGIQALSALTLTIDSGDGIVGVIGPNGAGKTTLLNVLTADVKPTEGAGSILGNTLRRRTAPERVARWGVAKTYQRPRPFSGMSVRENVLAAALASSRSKESHHKVDDVLELVKLSHVADREASQLGLSDRKRIELAKALAIDPKLILLDEMFEGLSGSEVREMLALLRGIVDAGVHLFFIEHVMAAMMALAETVVVLDKGTVLMKGEPATVTSDPRVRAAYLGRRGVA